MIRTTNIEKLKTEEFDVLIIGAGASGAGSALDATLRGMKVALIDRGDFVSETSSKSTKLIHGGVRYLEQAFKNLDFGQLKQVRHGLEERHFLLNLAPHLASPLGLLTPVFSWVEGFYYTIGLKIYALFAKGDSLPGARWLSKKETQQRMPGITANFHSSVLYYDGQFDDARYCLAMVGTAAESGATVVNYVKFQNFIKDDNGKLKMAEVLDLQSGEKFKIHAKVFLNCTGPFSDTVRINADPEEEPRMRPAKGVHIVFPDKFVRSKDAMLIPETSDGRVVFVKPLEGMVMAGTTDTAYNELEKEPKLVSDEVDYLLETLKPFLKKVPERSDIKAGFAGIRPLLAPKKSNRKDTKSLLRDHEVEFDERSGLISLLGGKWTTYRLMARDAVDFVAGKLGNNNPCLTEDHKLIGFVGSDFDLKTFHSTAGELGVEKVSREHLLAKYGSKAVELVYLVKTDTSLAKLIHPDFAYIQAEVVYAIRKEMAITLRDFFARRIKMELTDWAACIQSLPTVAGIFKRENGWSDSKTELSISEYSEIICDLANSAAIEI